MSLQFLYNFFGLQIPNVNIVVLWTRYNPFATSYWEIGKNTILFVLMSAVGFQAFSFRIIPQFESVVQCSGQNVFAWKNKNKFDLADLVNLQNTFLSNRFGTFICWFSMSLSLSSKITIRNFVRFSVSSTYSGIW